MHHATEGEKNYNLFTVLQFITIVKHVRELVDVSSNTMTWERMKHGHSILVSHVIYNFPCNVYSELAMSNRSVVYC